MTWRLGRGRCMMDSVDGMDRVDKAKAKQKSTESTQSTTYAEISANGALALLAVACSLLNRQMAAQEKAFVEEGGFTERLYRVRSGQRKGRA